MSDYKPLYPGRIIDVATNGPWMRTFDNSRKLFKFRYYYRRIRVPWLAWVMFH